MGPSCPEPVQTSQTTTSSGDLETADVSRRDALQRCSSIFAGILFASAWDRREAVAAGFSGSLDEMAWEREPVSPPPPIQKDDAPPQFADETVITPRRSQVSDESIPASESPASATVAANPPPPAAQVTIENSQVPVVATSTKQVPVPEPSRPDQSTTVAKPKSDTPSEPIGKSFAVEAGGVAVSLGGIYMALTGRIQPNTDALSPKAKVVMITPEPYGLDTGRRFYKGVDVTINDPVPASDVRRYCDAGRVDVDCAQTITGFLGDVSSSKNGMEPSAEQRETAAAVLSYLNTLSSSSPPSSPPGIGNGDGDNARTVEAFSSYLNGLSTGEIDAPSSPQSVANYLSSLRDKADRLSAIEGKVNALESSVDRLPEELSGMLEQWQERQDEVLRREFVKIEEYLMNQKVNGVSDAAPVNGEGALRNVFL